MFNCMEKIATETYEHECKQEEDSYDLICSNMYAEEEQNIENISGYKYNWEYQSACADEYKTTDNDTDTETDISSENTIFDIFAPQNNDIIISNTEEEKQESKIDNINVVQKELSKKFKHRQKIGLAGLYICTGRGWITDADLVMCGEKQSPVVQMLVPLISLNLELCVHNIWHHNIQIRGDGTNKHKYIVNKIYNILLDRYRDEKGNVFIYHKNTGTYYDLQNYTYNIKSWNPFLV